MDLFSTNFRKLGYSKPIKNKSVNFLANLDPLKEELDKINFTYYYEYMKSSLAIYA